MKFINKPLSHLLALLLMSIFILISISTGSLLAANKSNSSGSGQVSIDTLAPGSKYATELYIVASGQPGPTVMIVGGVHGSETAGYTAAAQIKKWTIDKGTLLVLPEANKLAIEIDRRYVGSEGDLNRAFPRSSKEKADNTLSRAIWSAIKQYDVDWLMDMHEGIDYCRISSTSVGQSLLYYPQGNTKNMANKIVAGLNKDISTSYKKFSLIEYPVKGSLARAAGQYLGVHSFIFETCDKARLSTRVNCQLQAAEVLLQELDMM